MYESVPPDQPRRHLAPEELEPLAREEYVQSTKNPDYGLIDRWQVYEYATEPMNYYATAFGAMDIAPDDTLLDVGCSDGVNLVGQRLAGHQGLIIGVDIDSEIFQYGKDINEKMNTAIFRPINFIAAKAEALPLQSRSVDAATALFMLYHTASEKALPEIQRVLKLGGQAVIATSGPENKRKQRDFEEQIAQEIGAQAPPIFTTSFDTTIAEQVLPDYFDVTQTISQQCEIRIPMPGTGTDEVSIRGLHAYLMSLNSMRRHFKPEPSNTKWFKAIRKLVLPVIRDEFIQNGYFTDFADRKLYVCTNTGNDDTGLGINGS